MLQQLRIGRTQGHQRALARPVTPVAVSLDGSKGRLGVKYSDGSQEAPACLRCPDSPCLRYRPEEVQASGAVPFSGDGDLSVCATGALVWPIDSQLGPSITAETCIGCGVCVGRCPVGAIRIESDGIATVLDGDTATLQCFEGADAITTRGLFAQAERSSQMATITDASVEQLAKRIALVGMESGPKFPTLFARNLLTAVGCAAAMRRVGDTNVRIDLLVQQEGKLCVAEVEYAQAAIDAPRSVLDGVAVLRGRYGVSSESILGLIVVNALPNQRSEYWQVIADVEKVLGLRIHTLTTLALVLLVWRGRILTKLPFATQGSPSIRADVEENLGERLALSPGVASAVEATK